VRVGRKKRITKSPNPLSWRSQHDTLRNTHARPYGIPSTTPIGLAETPPFPQHFTQTNLSTPTHGRNIQAHTHREAVQQDTLRRPPIVLARGGGPQLANLCELLAPPRRRSQSGNIVCVRVIVVVCEQWQICAELRACARRARRRSQSVCVLCVYACARYCVWEQ
jgi:hypothetical protein